MALSPKKVIGICKQYTDSVALGQGAVQIPGPPGKDANPADVIAVMVYEYDQKTPAAVWDIIHGLNYRWVSVMVVDLNGNLTIPDISFVSTTEVKLTFSTPTGGTAIVRR